MSPKQRLIRIVLPLLTAIAILILQPLVHRPLAAQEPPIQVAQATSSCWTGELGYTNFTSRYGGYSKRKVAAIAFSPDGNFLASGGSADGLSRNDREETLKIWNTQKRELAYNLDSSRVFGVTSLAFTPNGNFLVVGGVKGEVELWNWKNQRQKTPLNRQINKHVSVLTIATSPDNRTVASGGNDLRGNFLRLWTITGNTLQEAGTIPRNNAVYALAFSPDGKFLAVAGKGSAVELWNIAENKWETSFDTGTPEVFSVAFSPDGKLLASTGRTVRIPLNRAIKIWSLDTQELLTTLEGHGDRVNTITFSPDGSYLLSGSSDSTIRLWDVQTGQSIRSISTRSLELGSSEQLENILAVSFHPNGKQLAMGGVDKVVRLLRPKQCP